jgi:hypothetical protein
VIRRIASITFGFLALVVAACGSSGTSTSAFSPTIETPIPVSPPVYLTNALGTEICNDLLAWSKLAYYEAMPRFTRALVNDTNKATASNSQLGTDMASLEIDLTQVNSEALLPGPPSQPSDGQKVDYDCQQYRVNIPHWGPPVNPLTPIGNG